MNQFIFKLADKIYQYIFGYPMGERAKMFIKNLSIVAIGLGGASALSFGFTLLAGRLLGPEEYGKANLVFVIANFLIVPMGSGFSIAITKYLSSDSEKNKIIGSSTVLVVVSTVIVGIAFFFFIEPLAQLLKLDTRLLIFGLFYGVVLMLSTAAQSIFRGLKQFTVFSIVNFLSASVFAIFLFLFLVIFPRRDFSTLVLANMYRWAPPVIIFLAFFLLSLKNLDRAWVKKIFLYGVTFIAGAIPGFSLIYLNHILINYFLDIKAVGIYSAYFLASTFFILKLLDVFLTVFFPEASSATHAKQLFLKLVRLFKYTSLPLFFFLYFIIFISLKLFGAEYPFSPPLIFLFSTATLLLILQNIFGWLMASADLHSLRFAVFHAWVAFGIQLLTTPFLIRIFSLYGAAVALMIPLCYLVFVYIYYFTKVKIYAFK